MFSIELEAGRAVLATMAGRLRRNRIKIMNGDRVTLELSPYDLTKGRITHLAVLRDDGLTRRMELPTCLLRRNRKGIGVYLLHGDGIKWCSSDRTILTVII